MRWTGHVAYMGAMVKSYITLVRNPEGKRPLRKPWRRWENHIKVDHKGIESKGVVWIVVVQWRALVNAIINLFVP
jgi:hypothetical protein